VHITIDAEAPSIVIVHCARTVIALAAGISSVDLAVVAETCLTLVVLGA
jgi:hypothetical protein